LEKFKPDSSEKGSSMKFATKAIHAGQHPDRLTGAVVPPIHLSTTFAQDGIGRHRGYEYSRTANPTREALETCLAALENARYALAYASGLAATQAVCSLLKTGDHVIVFEEVYGGTFRLFKKLEENTGIRFSYVSCKDTSALASAIESKTKLVWFETPTNPLLSVIDIESVVGIAKKHGLTSVLDNTFASSYFQKPLDWGIDVVVHSTTKYMGGHSDVVGGAIMLNDEQNYAALKFNQNAFGPIPGVFEAWLTLRGLKTLAVRMEAHNTNAEKICQRLSKHPKVKHVFWPGLEGSAQVAIAKKQMTGFSGMLSFAVDGDLSAVERLIGQLKLIAFAESLGGVESLLAHPATMTHRAFPPEWRKRMGIGDNLLRLSVGIEDVEDIWEDLARGLAVV
jgi:cystathionine gamma-synthase/cystathionine gamma-lyase